ncbi:E3 ubiquitin ligase, partial [Coemansia sp. 'formosensis']
MPDDLVDDFVRDCSVEGQEQRPHSPDDHVSQVEFSTMRIEYLRRLLEQSVEAKVSLDKVNALNAELLVQRSELQAATERFSRINSALQCSICLDTLSRPHSLACGHIFCEDCLLQWFEMSLKCPACRANVSMRPAPAYAIKEIIALLNPHVGIESSPAPTSRTDGEAADPWALLFPARHELDTPGIYQDAARRTVAFEEEYRRATARSVGPDIEQDIQDMARRDRLSLLHNRLNLLTGGRTGARLEALPLLASRLATHETNVVADTPLNTEDIYTEDANNSIALLASAISRQVESYQEYLRRPGASSTSEMSQNSYSYLRDITELSMRTILGDARRSSQDMADPLLQPPLRLPPRPARMSSGPISSQASSPRIPIPPPRERPTTRPVRPATRAAPGSSSSPSIPIPPLSRLRQPTRFVRPEGTPAATTASPAVTTAAAASGLSVRNPIRISHIINNNNSSSSNSNSQAAQNGAARASRLQSRDNVATPPSQVLADSNGRLTQYIYRLLMIYQRFNDFNESTGSQNTTRRAISPTRRMSRVLDRAELLHPSDDDDDNNEQAAR